MSDILSIGEPIKQDTSILKKEYHTYTPYTQSFGNNDEIRIAIQSHDLYVLPSESYIILEATITFSAAAVAALAAPVVAGQERPHATFSPNFSKYLFSDIRYELNGVEIDRCKNPGITSSIKRACASRFDNFDRFITMFENLDVIRRTYRFIIPLNTIFGLADDYNKIILNAKHELILTRSRNDSNAFTGNVNENFINLNISKVHWKIPHIQLSDHAKLRMLRYLERKRTISIPFRSWELYEIPQLPAATKHIWSVKTTTSLGKPRYVFLGFQTNRNGRFNVGASEFDHCNVSDIKLYLNNDVYPYNNFDSNFGEFNYQEVYMNQLQIQQSYYPQFPRNQFMEMYPNFVNRALFTFDCSRGDDSLLNSTVDVRIEINTRQNIPPNTSAYCVLIHDNIVTYSPFDGVVNKDI